MQEISEYIQMQYEFKIKDMHPYKGGYVLDTNSEKKFLKKINISPQRILFTHMVKEHIYKNGITNIDRYIISKENNPYVNYDGYNYIMHDFIEGRECNFENYSEIKTVVSELAKFHTKVLFLDTSNHCYKKDNIGKMTENLYKRSNDLIKMKKKASIGKDKFDYTFFRNIDYFINAGKIALKYLEVDKYNKICETSSLRGEICHNDYTHSNLIFNKGQLYIKGFESCACDLQIYDLVNLIRRKMRKCNWNFKEAIHIINTYSNIKTISKDEFRLMYVMMRFPQKLWRVANRYYNSNKVWAEKVLYSKIIEVILEKDKHEEFMKNFENYFCE